MKEGKANTTEEIGDMLYVESVERDAGYVMKGHHCHRFFEVFCVESGACRLLINEEIFDLKEGEIMLIPPMFLHYTRYFFGACRRSVVFFAAEDLERKTIDEMPDGIEFFREPRLVRLTGEEKEQVFRWLAEMLREEHRRDRHSRTIKHLCLQAFLLNCARATGVQEEHTEFLRSRNPHVVKAARFIAAHFAENIAARDIAAASGLSTNYLSRLFRERTGIGPHEYLVFIRLQHAAQELVSTNDSITEIAFRCGFSDSNYFKDAFKNRFGTGPRAYRKQHEKTSV